MSEKISIGGIEAAVPFFVAAGEEFLSQYNSRRILFFFWGKALGTKLAGARNQFDVLLSFYGCPGDPGQFFCQIADAVKSCRPVCVNQKKVPALFLTWLLSRGRPAGRLMSVKTVDQLARVLDTPIPDNLRPPLQQVMDQYPVRVSDHVIRQSRFSAAVAAQYLPFAGELDALGHESTFEGHFKTGVVEQMYQNRVVFLLTLRCPVYCRFCFRKHKALRRQKSPSPEDVKAAVRYVESRAKIHEVLITGGEPVMHRKNLATAVSGLLHIPHVRVIRIATRSVAYFPRLFLEKEQELLQYLIQLGRKAEDRGKRLEIGVHFVHGDEVSLESLDIISRLTRCGIRVYLQTPFLGGVNSSGDELARLFSLLASAGCEMYYIFAPCHPIRGTHTYWTAISDAVQSYADLRAHLSDRLMPKLCTATSLGKIEWQSSGWAVEPDGKDHIWIRTPYTEKYFSDFTPDLATLPDVRKNRAGTLDVRMMAKIGDTALFTVSNAVSPENQRQNIKLRVNSFESVLCNAFVRSHLTRVEMNADTDEKALDYIRSQDRITDIILHRADQVDVNTMTKLIKTLQNMPHIQRVRVRAMQFYEDPEGFTRTWRDTLSGLTGFYPEDPFRIEIEAWFTLPQQITLAHRAAAQNFSGAGIPVYVNVPILSGLNDDPGILTEMAHRLRQAFMDFHHLYVAGLPIQDKMNGEHPVHAGRIIAIASRIRKECSGREIPLYVVKTPFGEVDFELTSRLIHLKGHWFLRLKTHDTAYLDAPGLGGVLPGPAERDEKGNILVKISGLSA